MDKKKLIQSVLIIILIIIISIIGVKYLTNSETLLEYENNRITEEGT